MHHHLDCVGEREREGGREGEGRGEWINGSQATLVKFYHTHIHTYRQQSCYALTGFVGCQVVEKGEESRCEGQGEFPNPLIGRGHASFGEGERGDAVSDQ